MTNQGNKDEELKLEYEIVKILQGIPMNIAFNILENARTLITNITNVDIESKEAKERIRKANLELFLSFE